MERADNKKDDLDHDDLHLRVPMRFDQISREANAKPSQAYLQQNASNLFLITSSPKPNICSIGEDQNRQQEKHLKTIVTLHDIVLPKCHCMKHGIRIQCLQSH